MSLTLDDWHQLYVRQARWTYDLRRYLYSRAGIESAGRVLEVGCGTGAILSELPDYTKGIIYGLDIDPGRLELAKQNAPFAQIVTADAHELPSTSASFDLCLCHFLLLWITDPARVVAEMARVTRPGAPVLALAEPDYGGRIDHPEILGKVGDLQESALRIQGANTTAGRRLAGIFHRVGLVSIETGVLGGQWSDPPSIEEWESEWQVLEADLQQTPGTFQEKTREIELDQLKQQDFEARKRGERVLFVPTFYALGRVPG